MLPDQRYGEPCWAVEEDWGVPETHPINHPGLCTTISYEERRLAAYYCAEDAKVAGPNSSAKSSL